MNQGKRLDESHYGYMEESNGGRMWSKHIVGLYEKK